MVQMIKMVHDGMMVLNGPKWFNPITHGVSDQRKIFEGTLKNAQIIAIFLSEKNFSKFRRKILKFFFELKMAIAQSIFKILGSSFLQTPPFL